jgi:hypothetical protein
VRLLGLFVASGAAIVASCSYDWQVAPTSDAGATIDAGSDAGSDAPPDGNDAGPDCAALTTQLGAAREAAKACLLGVAGSCITSIVDECGCTSYVDQPGSAANAFSAAVADFKDASCVATCSECLVSAGACLLQGSSQAVCVP